MTLFAFLQAEWPEIYDAGRRAERLVYADARASCFYAVVRAGSRVARQDPRGARFTTDSGDTPPVIETGHT